MKALLPLILLYIFCSVAHAQVPDSDSPSSLAQIGRDYAGAYVLVAINGNALPHTPEHEGRAPEVQSGTQTFYSDGTFSSSMTFRRPNGETITRPLRGTHVRHDSTIVMWWSGAGMNTATLSELGFIMNNEGILFEYRRTPQSSPAETHGHRLIGDNVVFVFDAANYQHVTDGSTGHWSRLGDIVIDSVFVAGDFNQWSSDSWPLTAASEDRFEMSVPITRFEGPRYWRYKFVVNDSMWVEPPSRASNSVPTDERNQSRNLVLILP